MEFGILRLDDGLPGFSGLERKMGLDTTRSPTASLILLKCALQGSDPEDSISFKDAYDDYKDFCVSEGHRKPYPKKQFREILEGEGYAVKNCTRHANQVRVFGLKNAEVAVV